MWTKMARQLLQHWWCTSTCTPAFAQQPPVRVRQVWLAVLCFLLLCGHRAMLVV